MSVRPMHADDDGTMIPDPESGNSGVLEVMRAVAPLSVVAFGGPQAHIGLIQRELVRRRGWTDDRTFAELLGLCSMLPGPTSTETIIGLGAMRAGLTGALAALLVWMAPAATLTTLGGIGLVAVAGTRTPIWLAGVQPAAVALVGLAAWSLGRKLVTDAFTAGMLLFGAVTTLLWQAPAAFPIVLLLAGLVGARWAPRAGPTPQGSDEHDGQTALGAIPRTVSLAALALFVALLLLAPLLQAATGWRALAWFDALYRAGSLVFGGGQVLLSVLLGTVTGPGWVSHAQLLSGLALVQALPGPLFSIGGFVGAALGGVGGALICLLGIFLPGLLLMIGLLPFWEALRRRPMIRAALTGINACAVGLVVNAVVLLYANAVHGRVDAALLVAALGAAAFFRAPAPLVIVGSALIGWPLHASLG